MKKLSVDIFPRKKISKIPAIIPVIHANIPKAATTILIPFKSPHFTFFIVLSLTF